MPRKSTRRPRSRRTATPTPRESPRTETPTARPAASGAAGSPFEESLELWTRYARQTGETVTEYLRRFGDEQQKAYEAWTTSLRDAARSTVRAPEADEARARLAEWNRRATEIGERVQDAFTEAIQPQREIFELWMRPFLAKDASAEDRTRESLLLVQKLWTGLTTDLARRVFLAFQPTTGVDEFVRLQEASIKEFTDSFQKLTQMYFTNPAFVTLFGKTLDASLDQQNFVSAQEDLFSRMTGLPSRKEISELHDAVRDLSEKVTRINTRSA